MFATQRQGEIARLVEEKGAVKIGELMALFSVSVETIRRDLLELERCNCLRRVHGGALRIPRGGEFLSRSERGEQNRERKAELAGYAAGLVREGDTILVDSGSTAVEFARMLAGCLERLTVITHSLEVFQVLRGKETYELYLCAGFYHKKEDAFYGPWALEMLDRFRAGTAFLCPSAISLQYGVMDYDRELFAVQQKMIGQAAQVVFLADSGKFEKSGLLKLADVGEGCRIVTDQALEDGIYNLYLENGVQVTRGQGQERKG